MFAVAYLFAVFASFLRLAITPVKPGPISVGAAVPGQSGAMPDYGNLAVMATALSNNAAPAFGNWSQTLVPASLSANTMSGGQLVGGIIRRFAPGSAFTDCTDTATNIVNAIPGATPLQTFPIIIANLGSGAATMTLAAGTGVTIAGTATIAGNSFRLFLGQVTGSAAVTLTNCFQWTSNPVGGVTTGL